jgi:hypothetical protein
VATGTLQIAPPTFEDPFVEENGRLSSEAFNWIVITLLPRITQTASVFGTTPPFETETPENDAIATTPLPLGSLNAGLYRVMTYLRVTSPDGVSSSVTPVVSFVDEGVTCQMEGVALTSDNIAEPVSQAFLVRVDAPGPISFSTIYASNTPNAMQYDAVVIVERVQ